MDLLRLDLLISLWVPYGFQNCETRANNAKRRRTNNALECKHFFLLFCSFVCVNVWEIAAFNQ